MPAGTFSGLIREKDVKGGNVCSESLSTVSSLHCVTVVVD